MDYRKKAVVIQAFKYGVDGWPDWFHDKVNTNEVITRRGEVVVGPFDYTENTWCEIHTLEGVMRADYGDYVIQGVKGELYPCKPDVFEATYDPETTGMAFGLALGAMKEGKKVARAGWNGSNQWVVMMPSLYLPPHSTQEPGAKVNDRTAKHIGVDTPLDSQPYCALFNAQGKWQPGWVPSQGDLFAEDWRVVD